MGKHKLKLGVFLKIFKKSFLKMTAFVRFKNYNAYVATKIKNQEVFKNENNLRCYYANTY